MSKLQAYQDMVDEIFGHGEVSLGTSSAMSNNVVGAIESDQYEEFTTNFAARLARLNTVFTNDAARKALSVQVKEIASAKNWEGAFAELAALDFFVSEDQFLVRAPKLDVDVDASRTLASKLGKKVSNLDIEFTPYDVYTDIKVLKDNVRDIMDSIFAEVWPDAAQRPLIQASYPYDSHFDEILRNRKELVERLTNECDGCEPEYIDCDDLVPRLHMRLAWGSGTVITESSYSPYRHAANFHRMPFETQYVKKFVTDRPFFLTFVVFPWFNQKVSSFLGSNTKFYRSLARRVFCQYRDAPTQLAEWNPAYTGSETVHEVSQYLGGLLFLEDNTILSELPDERNVEGFFYENPNAHHRITRGCMDEFLRSIVRGDWDDFADDNY